MTVNTTLFCSCLTAGSTTEEQKKLLQGHKVALLKGAIWPLASEITIRFLEGAPELQQRVRAVAEEWTKIANLSFAFLNKADTLTNIRIAFQQGNGSWSYLGTMCRQIPEPQPTMNYGWLTPDSPEDEVRRVVLHEFGHALGLIHEHQNPAGGIEWNRDAVIKDLSGPPNNWNLATIEENIFKKYSKDAVRATDVDEKSIMMYPIPLAWTLDGKSAGLNSDLSVTDRDFVAENYPK